MVILCLLYNLSAGKSANRDSIFRSKFSHFVVIFDDEFRFFASPKRVTLCMFNYPLICSCTHHQKSKLILRRFQVLNLVRDPRGIVSSREQIKITDQSTTNIQHTCNHVLDGLNYVTNKIDEKLVNTYKVVRYSQ